MGERRRAVSSEHPVPGGIAQVALPLAAALAILRGDVRALREAYEQDGEGMSELTDLTEKVREVRNMGASWPEDRCPVCGWLFHEDGCEPGSCSMRPMPDPPAIADKWEYATDISAAWELVKLLEEKDLRWILHTWPGGRKEFTIYEPVMVGNDERWKQLVSGMGNSPMVAICNGWLELEESRAAPATEEKGGEG